ncbi:MAG: type II toxin-antitoxin system PemK/MazF family toxin [Pyrinomonadaceae bacterium]|nr:type II toxin-antitoxin system PemK/MazF family toxin [Pyrinomonadaceae bacterium]
MAMVVKRFEIHLVTLNPTVGSEIQKTRPCIVISPDEMNDNIQTVIIAPMTTKGTNYKTRIKCEFDGKEGQIVLDQIRTVDKSRLVKRLGELETKTQESVLKVLREMFEE